MLNEAFKQIIIAPLLLALSACGNMTYLVCMKDGDAVPLTVVITKPPFDNVFVTTYRDGAMAIYTKVLVQSDTMLSLTEPNMFSFDNISGGLEIISSHEWLKYKCHRVNKIIE